MTTADTGQPTLDDVGNFLADYASWLFGCGATYMRLEKNVTRMAAAYGFRAELTVLSKHLSVNVMHHITNEARIFSRAVRPCGVNFTLNTDLSALSWHIRDRRIPLDVARTRFDRIITAPLPGTSLIPLLTSLANASFCRLFGGDAIAMTVVFMATLLGYYLKQQLLGARVDARIVFFVCAVVSSAVSAGATLFGWGDTPQIATATSVLYLIPGVLYINAAADLIDKHYVCSLCRFIEAAVLTAALSTGLYVGLWIMNISVL